MDASVCQALVDQYARWLREHTAVEAAGDACRIVTPFLDRHNDHLEIYVTRTQEGFRLSDDGYVLSDLELSGWAPSTPVRTALLEVVTKGFGVSTQGGELVVEARPDDLAQKKHCLIQAMLAVNDLFATSERRVVALFAEDVARFLREHEVRFTQDIKLTGKSGFDHHFDFVIPRSARAPERLIRAVRAPDRERIAMVMFQWNDTREARRPESKLYAFLDDTDRAVSPDYVNALRAYEIETVLWSRRHESVSQLAD